MQATTERTALGGQWKLFDVCHVFNITPSSALNRLADAQCILAPPADAGSTFKFYLSNWVVWQAQDLNVTHVLLEQVCTRPSMGASARDPYSVAPLEVHDRLPFDPEDRFYEATAARCEGGRSAAKGYRLALYRGEERVSTSPVRVICVYDEGQGAYIDSPGVDVMDWDDWRWKLVIDK